MEPSQHSLQDHQKIMETNLQAIKKIKSMLDVSEMETLAWARWGAVKWKRGQPRAITDNKYEESFLPSPPPHDQRTFFYSFYIPYFLLSTYYSFHIHIYFNLY